jgi:hypothetical protein
MQRVSIGWFAVVTLMNLMGCIVGPFALVLDFYSSAMSSFGPGPRVPMPPSYPPTLAWLWSPFATAANYFFHAPWVVVVILAIVWALFFGYLAGRFGYFVSSRTVKYPIEPPPSGPPEGI